MKRILMAAVVLTLAARAQAGTAGLRTPFGEVIVRNLKIGQTYSLYKLVNLPLRLVNTGDEEVGLAISVIKTSESGIREGFEPLPALDWIRIEQSSFTVAPNHEAATDVIISIPNDPALLGRRFEADIWSRTTRSRVSFGAGIVSKLLLQIDSTPPTQEQLKNKYVDERLANLDFTVLPTEVDLGPVAVGKELNLRKDRKVAVKLINPNDRALSFQVRSIPVWESLIDAPDGYVGAPDPKWLKPEKGIVKVDGNSIGDVSFKLDIPDEARVKGKKYFFIVSFDLLEQKIPTHVYYRLRATMPEPEKDSKPQK
jgi:hypothetical protein